MSRTLHPPGHPQAVDAGCLCPVLDNGHGRGCGYVDSQGAPLYVFNDACPLHGGDQAEVMDPNEVLQALSDRIRALPDALENLDGPNAGGNAT